jgi:predicted ATPase
MGLYDPVAHRQIATRFGQDVRVVILVQRARALWCLGYPSAALTDAELALKDASQVAHAATLAYASMSVVVHISCGKYDTAGSLANGLIALAEEIGSVYWKALGALTLGWVQMLRGETANAVSTITSQLAAQRSTGAQFYLPFSLLHLAMAHAELGQLDEAWRRIDETVDAMKLTEERLYEAEVHRTAGEIVLKSPGGDAQRAQAYFERALIVARQQQAKSWELRAAMSMARLWRDQGKRDEARELLAPVYGWFTEGFDTRDLKEAKALLDELAS